MQNHLHDFIKIVRQWPEHHRRIFAMSVSGVLTLIIATGWAMTLPAQLAGLSAPTLSPESQTAAASLSIATSSENQGTNTTQSLQGDLNQGSQIIDSFKSNLSGIFSDSSTSAPSAVQTQDQAPSVTITNPNPNQSQNQNSNPYSNLKYYVSDGVLITSPASGTATSSTN